MDHPHNRYNHQHDMSTKRYTSTLGRSAVYRIHGTPGAYRYVAVDENLSSREARRLATHRNRATADYLGLSFCEYTDKYQGREGWFLAGVLKD
jgi:hypothetical protein